MPNWWQFRCVFYIKIETRFDAKSNLVKIKSTLFSPCMRQKYKQNRVDFKSAEKHGY